MPKPELSESDLAHAISTPPVQRKNYEFTFTVGDTYVQVQCQHGKDPVLRQNGTLTMDETAAVHCFMQTLRCLSAGVSLQAYFNPTIHEEDDLVLVKCQWSRGGRLKMIGDADKHFMHAESVEQAMKRNRVFTCTRRVYKECPKTRR